MKKFLLILLILSCLLPVIATAETFSGTVDAPTTGIYSSWEGEYSGYPSSNSFRNTTIYNIQSSGGLSSWIYFPYQAGNNVQAMGWEEHNSTKIGNNISAQTDFEAYIGSTHVGSGYIGFQRLFNWLGQETPGYAYMVFNSWNPPTGATGTKLLNLTYDDAAVFYMRTSGYGAGGSLPSSKTYITNGATGRYEISTIFPFHNSYTLSQPAGIGVAGNVTKNAYPSRVFIENATNSGQIFASEPDYTVGTFNFTFVNVTPVNLAIVDVNGNWYNNTITWSSQVTPTPTQTAYPNYTTNATPPTLKSGYARTYIHVRDVDTFGYISGANIYLKDVLNSSWSNSTSDSDGIFWIDTLPNDYIDIHLDYPNVYYSLVAVNQPTPTEAGEANAYTWTEYLYPLKPLSVGSVAYTINVKTNTGDLINGATVVAKYTGGTNTSSTNQGIVIFTVPNNTALSITASKSGYISGTKNINSGPDIYNTTTVYLTTSTTTVVTTKTGVIATKVTVTGNATAVPTTSPPTYTGFFGPIADWFSAMGADTTVIGLLLAALFVFGGACVGGWSASPYQAGAPFNLSASLIGGIFGFILSVAFGFIPLVYIVAVIFMGVFWIILFR
jgi:hypothetical protein